MDYVVLNFCGDTGRFTVGCTADLHDAVRCDNESDLYTAIDILNIGFETRTLQVHCSLLPEIERLSTNAVSTSKLTIEQTQSKFGGTLTDYQASVYTELHNCE